MSAIRKKPATKRVNLVQTSVRLQEGTLDAIREMADEKGVPQSEIIRAAVTLFKHAFSLRAPSRLAVVDETDKRDEVYFRVTQFGLFEI